MIAEPTYAFANALHELQTAMQKQPVYGKCSLGESASHHQPQTLEPLVCNSQTCGGEGGGLIQSIIPIRFRV